MVSIPTSKVRDEFSETLNRVIYQNEQVVLKRHGKRVAAIVPLADFELLQRIRLQSAQPEADGGEPRAADMAQSLPLEAR